MMETLWLAGLLIANLWAAGNLNINDALEGARTELPDWKPAQPSVEGQPSRDEAPTPIQPPIKANEKPRCEKAPTNEEILRALPTLARGIPYVYEQYRDDMEFTVEKLVDRVDDPRFFSLIGPAQLHHCHWKCTVTFTEVIEITNPFPFTSKTRRTEVVYIDKDHLDIVSEMKQETAALPQSCPGGHYRPMPKATTKAESPRQVQMEITIVSIDRAVMPEETYQRLRKELAFNGENGLDYGVAKDRSAINKMLQKLAEDGFADLLARPNIVTMSDRAADFETGDIALKLLPIVKAGGRIHLKTGAHLTVTQLTKGGPATFGSTAEALASIADGYTLSLGGMKHNQVTLTQHGVPLLSELPYVGDFFTWNTRQESERELLILVTPHIVTPGDAAETAEPPLHDARTAPAPFPTADKIYVIVDAGNDGQQVTSLPAAEQTVLDAVKSVQADKIRKVRVSRVSADGKDGCVTLPVDWKAITEQGQTGSNYQLEAGDRVYVYVEAVKDASGRCERPTPSQIPEISGILTSRAIARQPIISVIVHGGADGQQIGIVPFEGQSVLDLIADINDVTDRNVEAIWITHADGRGGDSVRQIDWKKLIQSGRAGVELAPGDRLNISLTPAKSQTEKVKQSMSIDDVVRMSKAGVSAKIILRQMEMTNAVFDLTCDDIVYLREQGVSNRVISAMQERRTSAATKAEPPELLTEPPALTKFSTTGYPDQEFQPGKDKGRSTRFGVGGEPSESSPLIELSIPRSRRTDVSVTNITPYWHDGLRISVDADAKTSTGLLGHVWLSNDWRGEKLDANGTLHVEAYDLTSKTPVMISEWRFDVERLKNLKRTEDVGTGYALFLPWESQRPEITQIEMRVIYMPENGDQPQHAEPQVIRINEPLPIGLDFGFPMIRSPGDQTQFFSFWTGFYR